MRPRIRVGISGWRYSGWRGQFYPNELAQKRELEYASRQVNSIEINGSFYSLQRPENYHAWHEATPGDFVFSVKASRFLTHMRRLKDADTALANFLASGILRLREKLGPILWQLPPNFAYDRARLESFFRLLPRTTTACGWPRAPARFQGGGAGVDKGRVRVSIASRLGSASSLFRESRFHHAFARTEYRPGRGRYGWQMAVF